MGHTSANSRTGIGPRHNKLSTGRVVNLNHLPVELFYLFKETQLSMVQIVNLMLFHLADPERLILSIFAFMDVGIDLFIP